VYIKGTYMTFQLSPDIKSKEFTTIRRHISRGNLEFDMAIREIGCRKLRCVECNLSNDERDCTHVLHMLNNPKISNTEKIELVALAENSSITLTFEEKLLLNSIKNLT